jgi:hypothetical protein
MFAEILGKLLFWCGENLLRLHGLDVAEAKSRLGVR